MSSDVQIKKSPLLSNCPFYSVSNSKKTGDQEHPMKKNTQGGHRLTMRQYEKEPLQTEINCQQSS